MNASDRPYTCKSRGSTKKVAILFLVATGARVSNAYATYLLLWDSSLKDELIPYKTGAPHGDIC